jgi:hypothetical protein
LKSLYPKADIGAACEEFAATCTEDEEADLVQGFLEMATQIIELLPVDIS